MIGNIVFAQEQLVNPGITPDNPLYALDRAIEKLQLMLTFDDKSKAKLHLMIAEERLSEAKAMVDKGKPEFVEDLTKEYEVELNKCNEIASKAQEVGINVTEVRELVALATSKHLDVLEDVYEKVPEQAKLAIERAKNVSMKGQEEALKKLGEIIPERSAQLYLDIAKKKLEKALEKVERGRVEEFEELVEEYKEEMDKSLNMTNKAERFGKNVTSLVEHVCNMTYKHIEVLEDVLEEVPESAKPAIQHAIEVSLRKHENCMKNILKRVNKTLEDVKKFSCEVDEDCSGLRCPCLTIWGIECEAICEDGKCKCQPRIITCTVDAECEHLACPMMVGRDTPVCQEGRCICGPKWKISKTEWEKRFGEKWTNKTEEKVERMKQLYNMTEAEKITKGIEEELIPEIGKEMEETIGAVETETTQPEETGEMQGMY
jgi:hypothetical protein